MNQLVQVELERWARIGQLLTLHQEQPVKPQGVLPDKLDAEEYTPIYQSARRRRRVGLKNEPSPPNRQYTPGAGDDSRLCGKVCRRWQSPL